uniref:Uncharacterized protein n=1 Tax=Trichuris muris TaxID=70415 RepID=A0A5S6Q1M8_TRIMR
MEQVNRLRRSRAGLKARLTILAKEMTNACETIQNPLEVEVLVAGLDSTAAKLRKVQDELESSLAEDQLEQEVDFYMRMEKSIRDLRIEARLYLGKEKWPDSRQGD